MSMLGTMFETQADRSLARAIEVTGYGFTPYRPSELCIALVRQLHSRVGRDHAIDIGALAERLHTTPRAIKDAVRELRLRPFRLPIGSSRDSKGGGYFLCATAGELRETARQYFNQAQSELMVCRDLLDPRDLAEMMGQLQLELTKEEL